MASEFTCLPKKAIVALVVAALFPALPEARSSETTVATPGFSAAELRVQRTWMPDAHPGSFAVGFSSGLNVCFDPVRGRVAYAWEGDFVDLEPTIAGKFPRSAKINGSIFYTADDSDGFSISGETENPEIRFRGYQIRNSIPEFQFQIDGTLVRLTISASPDGSTLLHEFHVESWPDQLVYSFDPGSVLEIVAGNPSQTDQSLTFPAGSTAIFRKELSR